MTPDQRIERDMPVLLEELGMGPPPDYRDVIVHETATIRQRPAWTFPERWIPMDTTLRRTPVAPINWRLLAFAALLILAAAAIAVIAAGANRRLPAPPYGPAANGMIAYSLGGNIYLADPVTGTSRPIASGPERDSDPVFLPDGEHIIWVRTTSEGTHGVLADADGTNIRDLITPPCRDCRGWGTLGDSQTIFVTSNVAGRDITLENVVTGERSEIDIPGEVRMVAGRPPDDRQIAYVAGTPDEGYTLYSMNRDGTGRAPLASAADIGWFEYAPDGSQIAYEARGATDTGWTVRIVRSNGTGDRLLEHAANLNQQGRPTWSPDGQVLAVWRDYDGKNWMWSIIRPDGSLVRDYPAMPYPGQFRFSPDGKSIVFFLDPGSIGVSECPIRNSILCPAVILGVADESISTLPFAPELLWWQRRGR